MSDSSTAIATRDVSASFSLRPTTLDEAWQFAKVMAASDLVPKDYKGKPENCVIAVQMGAELGLAPMQAIQNIAVVNGRPSLFGDAVLAVCQGAADFEDIVEVCDGTTATCTVRRRGRSETTRTFSIDDAKKAGLWGKQGPWSQYPTRMLQMRARSFTLRDAYADRLKGISVTEEAQDHPKPEPSEPRRVGESATPGAAAVKAAQAATSAPTASDAPPSPVAPTDVATSTSAAPAQPQAAAHASVAASVSQSPDQVEPGVKVLNTSVIVDGIGDLYEIETTRGVFYTRDKARYEEAATCEGTETALAVTWRAAKRKKNGKLEPIKALIMLALDDEAADKSGGA